MIFALLDRSREIAEPHVLAALAVWRYCADSASLLFGELTTDARANAVLEALGQNSGGLSRTQIHRDVFSSNVPAQTLTRLLTSLVEAGVIRCETIDTGGRAALYYFAARATGDARSC